MTTALTNPLAAIATPVGTKRDLVSIQDLTPEEITGLLDLATAMKHSPADFRGMLAGKQLVLFFEKPSLRTRLTFESAMNSLGGVSFFVDQTGSRLGDREPLSDIAHNLERWIDGIVLRTFAHETVAKMAEYAAIPVINALSDFEHPCQALADTLTVREKFGELKGAKIAYVGDGNNVAHSLLLAAAAVGAKISVGTPKGFEPNSGIVAAAKKLAVKTGAKIHIVNDPVAAVTAADVVYTDVWASMGQEAEASERKKTFAAYQVNDELMAHASKHALFMHCLPAHRGDEVAASVIDSARSIVFDEAENRLHIQKAILVMLMGGASRAQRRNSIV
ncbi:MAG: ornithine carbamoyltransferase [Terriglobia bacterium]|nr:ornithine carbamoyltransferase [Terriglobia bacterium]